MWQTGDRLSNRTRERSSEKSDKCLKVALPSLSFSLSLSRDFPCQMEKNKTQMHHEHTGASESWVRAGDVAEAALQVCLNKVKFNCGHVAGV